MKGVWKREGASERGREREGAGEIERERVRGRKVARKRRRGADELKARRDETCTHLREPSPEFHASIHPELAAPGIRSTR